MKNTGQYSAAALKGLNAQTEALATHGGFSVASQLPAVTQLVGATHNLTEAQKLNVAATNLARGAHLDYAKAVTMVEGAAIGQGRQIQKLVGVIVPVTKYTYGWTAAMKAADQVGYQHAQTLNKLATGQEILSRVQADLRQPDPGVQQHHLGGVEQPEQRLRDPADEDRCWVPAGCQQGRESALRCWFVDDRAHEHGEGDRQTAVPGWRLHPGDRGRYEGVGSCSRRS